MACRNFYFFLDKINVVYYGISIYNFEEVRYEKENAMHRTRNFAYFWGYLPRIQRWGTRGRRKRTLGVETKLSAA